MRLSILGYKQSSLIANNIGIEEVLILRHFSDFCTSPNMKHIEIDGDVYYWISYKKVLEDLPILNLSVRTIPLRYEKLVNSNILKKYVDKTRSGTYTYFKLTENYFKLMEDNFFFESENKKGEDSKNRKKPINTIERFEKFYSLYPKKKNRGQAEKSFKKMVTDDETLELIIKDLDRRNNYKDWKKEKGKFIPYPSTYLNAKGWLDEYETEEPKKVEQDRKDFNNYG